MAVEAERLLINIEASTARLEREMRRARQTTDRELSGIERRASTMATTVNQRFATMARGIGVSLAAAFSLREARQFIDSATRIQNSLRVVGLEGKALNQVYDQLYASAQRNAAPLETLATMYGRVARSQKELGVSSAAVMTLTDNLAMLLRVGGTSVQEASGALLQLSQALGGGVVRAEEFNSVLEGAPTIMQAAAIGIKEAGGSIAQLRKLMLEGRVSSRALFEGINVGAEAMAKNLDGTSTTIDQALTRLNNAFTDLAKRFNENAEAGKALNSVIDGVVDTLNNLDVAEAIKGINAITTALETVVTAFNNASLSAKDFALRISEINDQGGVVDSMIRMLPEALRTPNDWLFIESARMKREREEGANQQTNADMDYRFGGSGIAGGKTGRVLPNGQPAVEVNISKIELPENAVSVDDYAVADDGTGKKKKVKLASAPINTARRYIGLNESRDRGLLMDAMREQGINIDPAKTAWCAAFMDLVLKSNGLPGTGKLNARSYLNYGEATNDPRQGDIVVLKRGNNNTSGHVGFVEGFDENGNVRVLGGNQSDGVNVKTFNKKDVLGYRSVPGADRVSMRDSIGSEIERRNEAAEAVRNQDQAYRDILATGAEYIVQLQAEADQSTMTAQQAAAMRYEQDLLNQAQQAGITLTDGQREQLKLLAEGMAEAEVASQNLAQAQAELSELAKGAFKGFAQDLMNGKSAAEAFEGVLGRIADKLLDMALDGLFQSILTPGKGGGGGLLGLIGSFFGGGKAVGGSVSSQKMYMVGEKGPELFAPGRSGTIIPNHNMPRLSAPNVSAARAATPDIKLNVINNTGVQADTRTERQPDGSMSVILDKAVAQKIATRGTETNNAFRQGFGARERLARR